MPKKLSISALYIFVLLFFSCTQNTPEWNNLIDNDLSKWDIFLGIPHKSSGIPGYENVDDVRGVYPPLGLGNKKNVFSVIEDDGENIIKITGEIFGALVTKEEFEIEETNFGDFITINNRNVTAECPATKRENGKYHFDPNAPMKKFNWKLEETGRCFKSEDFEKPFGEWNTVELVAYKNTNIHIINGEVVNVVYNPVFFNGSKWVPMTKGKLQLQSEAAETYFKNIKIKPITEIDVEYKKYVK